MMAAMKNREFEIDVEDLLSHFGSLEDPRSEVNRRHPLKSVIMITIMAMLAGAGGPTAIALWASNKEEWLSQILPLPHGVPKKDVYRRVLMTVNPQAFQACFNQWLQSRMALLLVIKGLVAIALVCVFLMIAQPRYQLRTIEEYLRRAC